jgi:hypothetical protein
LFRDWRAHLQREADRNRRHHCGRSGQTVRRAPTPRASGHPIHLAPQDILFVFHEVEPNLPRFPAASIRRN